MREPGKRLPDRDELGFLDEDAWEGPGGERQDPWQNTRLVYFVDPETADAFTFSTSSWGGRSAVADLGDAIAHALGAPRRRADRRAAGPRRCQPSAGRSRNPCSRS